MSSTPRRRVSGRAGKAAVVLIGATGWPASLADDLDREGYAVETLSELDLAPAHLCQRTVDALLVMARPFGATDVLAMRQCRHVSPRTALVVVSEKPPQPDLKRAFESGATAFLSWPASVDALRRALRSRHEDATDTAEASVPPRSRRRRGDPR